MDYLFNPDKMNYVKGKNRPNVECILCAIKDNLPGINKLEVLRTKLSVISVNLYPYNSGHVIIFPLRHVTDLRHLTEEESLDIERITKVYFDVCDMLYEPKGYNIGYNLGKASGASIAHVHRHIVPRYHGEQGFISVLGGTKLMVEDPNVTMTRLKEAMGKYKDKLCIS